MTINWLAPGIAGIALAAGLALAMPGMAGVERGPQGGHLVDAGDRYHLELVVNGQEMRLFVSDRRDAKVPVEGGSARATVISAGGKGVVELAPIGGNVLGGKGSFARSKTMKVDVVLRLPGVSGAIAAKFQPLAAEEAAGHDHKGHKH